MKYEVLYNSFLQKIAEKVPQKTKLVNILTDMLHISKEAVYRRLKGDISFSFNEVITISRQLDISLDNLGADNASISKPFKLNLIEHINPSETDFALMEEMTSVMKSFKEGSNPEVGELANILPQPLYANYENIFRFYLFKWKYQSNKSNTAIPYKDITVSDKLNKIQAEYVKWAKKIQAEYIFDNQLFKHLIIDIKYFFQVKLLTSKEIELIQKDLLKILDDIEFMTRTGFIKETGKKINIYISNINVDTNYIYISAADYQLTIIKAFLLNGIASTDKSTFEEVKCWMQSAKWQSILITKSSEKERFNYLKEQQDIIESLSQL